MAAIYLKGQGLSPDNVCCLCALSKATLYRYLHAYRDGGIENSKRSPIESELISDSSDPACHNAVCTDYRAEEGWG